MGCEFHRQIKKYFNPYVNCVTILLGKMIKLFHYTTALFSGVFLVWSLGLCAEPCSEHPSAPPPPPIGSAPVPSDGASPPPPTGPVGGEPTSVKDQMGLTLNPSSMVPDQPIVDEKKPDRKK